VLAFRNVICGSNFGNFGTAVSGIVRRARRCDYAPRALAANFLPALLVVVRVVGT
jgi:hypothetical protein